ncbi:MAG: hypothetical protein HY901_17770 [Deltaproteobacteria bacterium]|nr:hypothetical protein [Deltaproteobacteria bacterium]
MVRQHAVSRGKSRRRPAWCVLLALALVAATAAAACHKAPPSPPPAWLPRVPDGYGEPYEAKAVLGVQDRRLRLPTGQVCGAEAADCAEPLAALQGQALALELDGSSRMADLSAPLAALALALRPGATACLAVADSQGRRCVPFRPFSGDDFGAWLDADKPLGKLRVIMRSDGMEVVADRGKLPGPDRYGPSLPPVEGKPDFAGLDRAASLLAVRFRDETVAGLAPSPSLPVAQVAHALALLNGPGGGRFETTFLVYP